MICSSQDAKNAKLGIVFSFGAFAFLREILRSRLPRSSAKIFVLKADEGVGQAYPHKTLNSHFSKHSTDRAPNGDPLGSKAQ